MKYIYAGLSVLGFAALLWLTVTVLTWIARHELVMWITVVGGVGILVYLAFRAFLEMFDAESLFGGKQ
jgi:hypothetical protein